MHTPGPWTAEPPGIYGYGADDDKYWSVQTDDQRICLLTGQDDEESDARLIAAAPELLAALKALTLLVEVDYVGFDCLEQWRQAVAAIAKAEGRE
jgi:hypothetical protein